VHKKIISLISTLLLLTLSYSSAGIENSTLSPTVDHLRATKIITDFLGRYHYRKVDLNDEFSATIFDNFLDSLDSTKSYFLATDIARFDKYRFALDDALRANNLLPAYSIFSTYQKRVSERIEYALLLIEKDFDFSMDETFVIERESAKWPITIEQQNDLWRKRIKNDVLSLVLADKEPDEIKKTLVKRYSSVLKRTQQLDENDIFQLYINSYATAIDPHTSYLSPRSFDNFEIRMSLSLEGIGALLRSDGDNTVVERIIPGGPADLGKLLHAKDKIIGISQQNEKEFTDVLGWRLEEVVELIRGPKDTIVKLQILPGSKGDGAAVEEISITRNKIKLEEQAATKNILEIPHDNKVEKIGVVTIPTFYLDFNAFQNGEEDYRSTTRDVHKLLGELLKENIDSLVLDLRSNGGGSLIEATQLAGLFIDKGPIVQVRDSSGHIEIHKDKDASISYNGPMVVLVDRFSASASEIVASALQDYGRAVIVGETTFGKGSVQQLVDLNRFGRKNDANLGQLKATIAQYYRINGESTQHRGVEPDIPFEASYDKSEQGERSLPNALPWTKISPTQFDNRHISKQIVNDLASQHVKRTKDDKKYQSLIKLYNLNESLQKQTELSLNQSKREKTFSQLEQDRKAFEQMIGIRDTSSDDDSDDNNGDAKDNIENDILLIEAAQISADLNSYWSRAKQRMIVQQQIFK
jgi:carboxyl-terminal processing protease